MLSCSWWNSTCFYEVVSHSSNLLLFCIWTVMSGKNTDDEKSSADLQSWDNKILLIIAIWFVNSCYINLTTIMTTEDHNFRVWQGRITPQMIQNHVITVYCFSLCILLTIEKPELLYNVFVSSFSPIPIFSCKSYIWLTSNKPDCFPVLW